jgi:DNA replication protein DnaD
VSLKIGAKTKEEMQEQSSYHNTTHEPTQLVIDFERKAKHQEDLVLKHWVWNRDSPSRIYQLLIDQGLIAKNTPLTSIRRAISNLTKRGLLRKTNVKVQGLYGRTETLWERI